MVATVPRKPKPTMEEKNYLLFTINYTPSAQLFARVFFIFFGKISSILKPFINKMLQPVTARNSIILSLLGPFGHRGGLNFK